MQKTLLASAHFVLLAHTGEHFIVIFFYRINVKFNKMRCFIILRKIKIVPNPFIGFFNVAKWIRAKSENVTLFFCQRVEHVSGQKGS